MTIPTYEKLMLPLLKMLKDNKTYTNNECIDILAKNLNITYEEKNLCFSSGKKRILYFLEEYI